MSVAVDRRRRADFWDSVRSPAWAETEGQGWFAMANTEALIQRRVNKGFSRGDSEQLLSELCEAHIGDNLVHALVYNEFATRRQAERFVELSAR